jgi:integrase
VRRWRKERLDAGPKAKRPFGPVTVAKAYRLLHAILETAAEQDRIIPRNPCHITGAGKEESPEREIVPLPVIFKIAESVPVRYRALVLLATFADMRWGELAGLRRENIDLDACEIRITETLAQLDRGGLQPGTPKSGAGKRTVAFPAEIAPEIRWHLDRFAEPGERGYVFVGPKGGKLRRSNFRVSVWSRACQAVGLPTPPFSRSPPYGRHPLGRNRRDPQRADGPPRLLQHAGGHDLPARHPRPRPSDRESSRHLRQRGARHPRRAQGRATRSAGTRRARRMIQSPVWHVWHAAPTSPRRPCHRTSKNARYQQG